MKEQLQKTSRKYVTAEEIYNFLKAVAANGIVNMTRQDLATHFNYKTGNGDGFRANIKMLEREGLITDISKDKRHPAWKIDMDSDFDFSTHPVISTRKKINKEQGGANMTKQSKNIKGVDLEQIHLIDYMGRKYIQLMDITKVLGIDRRPVYNAVTNSNKLVGPYIKSLPITPGAQAKKAIELEGLTYLFAKLEGKVSPKILKAVKDYIDDIATSDNNVEELNNTSTVVNFPFKVSDDKNSFDDDILNDDDDNDVDDKDDKDDIDDIDDEDDSVEIKSEQLSLSNLGDVDSMEISDVLTFLDGLTAILREHSEMKETMKEKDSLILSLQNEIKSLKNELLKKPDSSEIESLISELLKTQEELSKAKEELSNVNILKAQILAKASQMKRFIGDNNPMKALNTH